jgi:hypothetical protein
MLEIQICGCSPLFTPDHAGCLSLRSQQLNELGDVELCGEVDQLNAASERAIFMVLY